MKNKAENPASLLENKQTSPIVELFFNLSHLKQVYRQGWLRRGVPPERCESVAEHSFSVAMLAMVLADRFPELDRLRVLELALVHDFGEIHAGDITPGDGVPKQEKTRREKESFALVLRESSCRDHLLSLFEEYEAGRSPEAKFVHELEKLEMALQASVYEQQGLGDFSEFLDSAEEAIEDPRLKAILEELRKLRK